MKEKKGISLIVLIVTIIVMIIIAGAIILSLTETNVIDQAEVAVEKHNLAEIKSAASMAYADWVLKTKSPATSSDVADAGQVQNYIRKKLIEQGLFTWQESSKYYITKTGGIEEINPEELILIVEIPENSKKMQIDLNLLENGTVDWGDDTGIKEINKSSNALHYYSQSGEYEIKMNIKAEYIDFNGQSDAYKIKEIKSWGNTGVKELWLYDATSLEYVACANENSFKDLSYAALVGGFEELPDYLFYNCKKLEEVDCYGCSNLKYIPEHIFEGCDKLTTVSFADCPKIENVPAEWQ